MSSACEGRELRRNRAGRGHELLRSHELRRVRVADLPRSRAGDGRDLRPRELGGLLLPRAASEPHPPSTAQAGEPRPWGRRADVFGCRTVQDAAVDAPLPMSSTTRRRGARAAPMVDGGGAAIPGRDAGKTRGKGTRAVEKWEGCLLEESGAEGRCRRIWLGVVRAEGEERRG